MAAAMVTAERKAEKEPEADETTDYLKSTNRKDLGVKQQRSQSWLICLKEAVVQWQQLTRKAKKVNEVDETTEKVKMASIPLHLTPFLHYSICKRGGTI